jgi:universal stress protein E
MMVMICIMHRDFPIGCTGYYVWRSAVLAPMLPAKRGKHMRPIRRILVAINDPGARTLPTVAKAALIARACDAHLELFHSIKASVFANTPEAYDEALMDLYETQRLHYIQRLGRIAARLRLHRINVSTAVEYDYPAYDAIVRRACLTKADLIVAGRYSSGRTGRRMLRLTDWELLRHSPVPVLLVRRSRAYRHPNLLVAVDPGHAHSKPADLDDELLDTANTLARALRGKLHAVHAYSPVVIGSAATSVSASVATRLEGVAGADAKARFERLLASSDIPRTRRYLVSNYPAPAIDEAARRTNADIVVMGAVSRSGLKRLFIGNTAESLLDALPCDLLIVKPRQFSSRVPVSCNGPRLIARTA